MRKAWFINVEGIDGSGKESQSHEVVNRFTQMGIKAVYRTFPRYDKPHGDLIKKMLHNECGESWQISPYAQSLIFAADRFDAAAEIRALLAEGTTIVCDRYVNSNIGHQGAKLKTMAERLAFIDWIKKLEYEYLNLPKPDVTILLQMPIEITLELLKERSEKKGRTLDQHEADAAHLREASAMFSVLAQHSADIITISCAPKGSRREDLLSIPDIHTMIWKQLTSRLKTHA